MRYIHGSWIALCVIGTVALANIATDDMPARWGTAIAFVSLLFMATIWATGFVLILAGEWLYRRHGRDQVGH